MQCDELSSLVESLAVRCPLGDDRPTCPLHAIRRMSAEERATYLSRFTSAEQEQIVAHHCACYAERHAEMVAAEAQVLV